MKYSIGDLIQFHSTIKRYGTPRLVLHEHFDTEHHKIIKSLKGTIGLIVFAYHYKDCWDSRWEPTENDNAYIVYSCALNRNVLVYENEIRIVDD